MRSTPGSGSTSWAAAQAKPVTLGSVPEGGMGRDRRPRLRRRLAHGRLGAQPRGDRRRHAEPGLLDDFRRALPDFTAADNVGSPYCVRRYAVDAHLGGPEGLARRPRELAKRGLRLILDFVPNHVAPDHPWVAEHPEYFIRGDADDDLSAIRRRSSRSAAGVFACGRDPYFPAWPDVLQLNAFDAGLRAAVDRRRSATIAEQCDGVRCDMAMLVMNDIFAAHLGRAGRARRRPTTTGRS